MKTLSMVKRLFLTTGFILLLQTLTQAQGIRMFHIERNKNSSIVCYDLEVDKNKSIDGKNPINAYWEMPDKNNARNTLSAIQYKLAYGVVVDEIKEDLLLFKLKAYPERELKVVYDSEKQQANAFMLINGVFAIVSKLYIHATPPLYSSVEYIILTGFDPETGNTITEKIINGKTT